jgi:hypothetical protein
VIAQTTSQETPMGTIEVVSRLTDYEQFGDILVATTVTQNMMGQEQVMEITDMQIGEVDPSLLEPPAEIQTLIRSGG